MTSVRNSLPLLLTFLLLVAGAAWAAPADDANVVVGSSGEVLRLSSGSYGALFPDGGEADPEALVLALDVDTGDSVERHLVPGSESMAQEETPTLYHDPTVDVTYVLWSSRQNGVHPYLRLVPLGDDGWGELLDIIGSVFAPKFDPALSVQHDSAIGDDGDSVERSTLSVLWWEEGPFGAEERIKSLVLEDGDLVASGATLSLGDFGGEGKVGGIFLEDEPLMKVVGGSQSFLVGFADSADGSLRILAVDVMPVGLSRLAAAARQVVEEFDPFTAEHSLEETIFAALLESGGDQFHPAALRALTEEILGLLGASDQPVSENVPDEVMDKIGPHVIHIGARMKTAGLVGQEVDLVKIDSEGPSLVSEHYLAVSEASRWSLPEAGDSPRLFISKRGNAALVAWNAEGAVVYRETMKDAWGPEQSIEVTESLDRGTIYRILEERTLER